MKIGVYSMKDRLNGFMNLFPEQNDDVAKRGFLFALKQNKDSLFACNPDDYSLYKIGEFDTDSGCFEPLSTPAFLIGGATVVRD